MLSLGSNCLLLVLPRCALCAAMPARQAYPPTRPRIRPAACCPAPAFLAPHIWMPAVYATHLCGGQDGPASCCSMWRLPVGRWRPQLRSGSWCVWRCCSAPGHTPGTVTGTLSGSRSLECCCQNCAQSVLTSLSCAPEWTARYPH